MGAISAENARKILRWPRVTGGGRQLDVGDRANPGSRDTRRPASRDQQDSHDFGRVNPSNPSSGV